MSHQYGMGPLSEGQTGTAPITMFRHPLLHHFQLTLFSKLPLKPMTTLADVRYSMAVGFLQQRLAFCSACSEHQHPLLHHFQLTLFSKLPLKPMTTLADVRYSMAVRELLQCDIHHHLQSNMIPAKPCTLQSGGLAWRLLTARQQGSSAVRRGPIAC